MATYKLDTPAKHPRSVVALLDTVWNASRDALFKTAWSPTTRLAESAVVALMQRIKYGRLRVLTFSHIYTFPAPDSSAKPDPSQPTAELRVVSDVFWIRLFTMGDLGFSEAYMYGEVECDDLVSLFQIFLANRENLANMSSAVSWLFSIPHALTNSRFLNTISNSRSNISAHYDISNEMFAAFLSRDMTYSCGIFDELDGDLKRGLKDRSGSEALERFGSAKIDHPTVKGALPDPSQSADRLEEAQIRKLHHILRKADVRPGHRVLEIGSGWGSFAILAVQTTGCQVDTITLSVQQQALARQRIAAAGLEDKIRVHLVDYRNLPPEWEGLFDRVVSIEMIEAVGHEFLSTYWGVIDWAMKKKGGVGVVQAITIPEPRFERYVREIDFIRKWVFPGGFLPTVTLMLDTMQSGASGRLICDSITNIGPHYAQTLREWRRRFQDTFDSTIVPSLIRQHPEVMTGPHAQEEIEVFKRKWLYYFCYSEIGFSTRTLGDHIVTFMREGVPEYNDLVCS
ncbi:cyclopropane-fatty-acyl-phospholipid synthase [Sistotremastrum niveocremeum HHB9708]|uniref:Cyclopropane-fatty-acyl-phospholipid synthase n=1 Tax=Sistotremastrum niveocremeum HHB9708 TaxID=1314777 RepID=A0A164UPG9_9AGAM|nr:cyclopropane-fatty-acyl-phospholipid synthase [Sistotremastrum niveocremeum HHB9708]